MAIDVRLPKLSDEMTEGTISRWLKEVGESVDKGEPLAEVETEKVIVEVEAPEAGVIVEIVAAEQDVVAVDAVICRLGKPGEVPTAPQRESAAEPPAPQPPVQEPPPEPPPPTSQPPAAAAGSNVVPLVQPGAAAGTVEPPRGTVTVQASPLARRVAEELGIDLMAIAGTGYGGKIVMADLQPYLAQAHPGGDIPLPTPAAPSTAAPTALAAASPAATPPATAPDAGTAFTDVPHSGLRRTIARRMGEAKHGIPHFYMTAEVDVTAALALRTRLNEALSEGRVSVNDLMLKATALALEQVPELNATFTEGALRRFSAVHIGFAAAVGEGLVTPVVRDCHLKSIGRIARDAAALVARARERALTAEDLQGGTFTISNLGMYDLVEFSAIINPPQVGILAIATPQERPVAERGRIAFRSLLRATLSADHRAVDGVTGAVFLQAFKAVLEQPERLML